MNKSTAQQEPAARISPLHNQQQRKHLLDALTYLVLAVLLVVVVFPLFWMVVTSFKPLSEVRRYPPTILPQTFTFENYIDIWQQYPFGNFLFNSFFISIMGTFGAIFSCTLAGFPLARLRFPGQRILFVVVLATLMIPYPARMIPLFVLMSRLGWIDTYLPLIVPWFFGNAYGVFLMRQFFKGIPGELMEAAVLDGCNPLRVLLRIYLPLAMPALTALAVVTFTTIWNDFIPPLIFINTMEKMPVAVGLAFFKGQGEAIWSYLMAASVLSALPLLLLYVFAQRYIIESMAMTGLKR
jgi:multiple sugar transport system permease protein